MNKLVYTFRYIYVVRCPCSDSLKTFKKIFTNLFLLALNPSKGRFLALETLERTALEHRIN